ncbi:MAG: hypothetical protein ACRENX_03100 [Candidatus Dormibacteria bacterium]
MEQLEQEVLMGALLRISEGGAWSEIHAWLLETHTSSRVHMIAKRLLEASSAVGLKGVVATPSHEVALELGVCRLGGLGRLVRGLQQLQTPYRITIGANSHDSGSVQASWNLGLDEPSVALRGEAPGDPKWRQRLLAEMSTLLVGGLEPRLPGRTRRTPRRGSMTPPESRVRPSPNWRQK